MDFKKSKLLYINGKKTIWQKWQIDFLKENWMKLTAKQLSDEIGITRTLVREKKYELGLYKLELEYWSEDQISFLKENYRTIGNVELAEIFNHKWYKKKGWTKNHIEKKLKQLHLIRTIDESNNIRKRNANNGRYNTVELGWKKRGKAIIGEVRTWYLKNGIPLKVIKTKNGFVHYARWLWENEFGPVPKGYKVRVRDGDPLNIVIDNLFLVNNYENCDLNRKQKADKKIQKLKLKHRIKHQIYLTQKTIKQYEK